MVAEKLSPMKRLPAFLLVIAIPGLGLADHLVTQARIGRAAIAWWVGAWQALFGFVALDALLDGHCWLALSRFAVALALWLAPLIYSLGPAIRRQRDRILAAALRPTDRIFRG